MTGTRGGRSPLPDHLASSSSRLSSREQSTAWNSSVEPPARWPGLGGAGAGLPVAVKHDVAVHGGSDPEGHGAGEVGLQLPWHRLGVRALGAADEVDPHRPPQPGDLTEPPAGGLLGGAGGPVVAQVAAGELRHLVHHHQQPGPTGRGSWRPTSPPRGPASGGPQQQGSQAPA